LEYSDLIGTSNFFLHLGIKYHRHVVTTSTPQGLIVQVNRMKEIVEEMKNEIDIEPTCVWKEALEMVR